MASQNTNQSYQTIINALQSLRTQWRLVLLFQSVMLWLGILALTLAAILVIDQLLPLHRVLRMGLVIVWLGVGVYTGFRYLIRTVFQKLTHNRVAAYIETSYSGFENRVLSAVQLKSEIDNNRFGYALSFIEKLIEQARQSIEQVQPKRVFEREFSTLKKNGVIAVGGIVSLILIHLIFPSALKDFARAFDEIPKTPQEMLIVQIDEIQPGNTRIESGSDVTFTAKVTGHLGANVHLSYRVWDRNPFPDTQRAGEESTPSVGNWRSLLMTRSDTEIAYRVRVRNVTESMEYYITSKETKSEHYQISVTRAPIVSRFQLKLNYPKYTQLSPQVLEENLGDVTALIGTEVQFAGESNKTLASARFVFDESEPVKLKVSENNRLAGRFIVQRSEKYRLELIDADGTANSRPIVYTVNAIADATPQVEIVTPGRDIALDESMLVTLQINAQDDYGVQKMRLVYRVEGQSEKDIIVPLKTWQPTETTVFIEFPWDLNAVGLFPEDVVSYHVEATDADNITGPNVGKSDIYTIRFPSLAELYAEVESEQEREAQGLDALYDKQAEATAIIDELLDKLRKSQDLTQKDEKVMQQVLETQKQIEQTAKELVEEMKQTSEQMEKKQLFDLQTVEKFQELQKLMDEALSEEHKELLRKLSEALEEQQLSEQEKKLMEANLNQEQFLQQLDRLKSLYEQLILQQKLEAAVNQAKDLADRQEKLMVQAKELLEQAEQNGDEDGTSTETDPQAAPQQENASRQDLANREDKINEGLENLQEKLGELGEQMSEHENLQRVADEIKRLNQLSRDQQIGEQLQATSSQMRANRMQDAMQPGQQAQQRLGDLHQSLDNAMEFMEGANSDEALAAMREGARSGLYLSRTHEKVLEETNEVLQSGHGQYTDGEIKRLQSLAANELSLAAGIDRLADKLWELGKQQMQIDPKIVWRLNEASDALGRSAKALEDRKPSLASPIQKQGFADLNKAVSELLNAMNQMNQQMSASGLENMLEQLQQLAQNQGELNEMARNLNQQRRQQGNMPGVEEMMKRMAYEQQLIREATERLSEMMEKLSQVLGDLKGIAQDMKEVEQELQGGSLNEQVLKKQHRILTRMLESAKSLQKRDVSKKRKSTVALKPGTSAKDAPPLDPKLLELIQQLESKLKSGEAERIPPQYRERIEQYFKALSQQAQGAKSGGE